MRRGFSLIELLVVIAIILVIIMLAVPNYQKAQVYAREMAAAKAVQTVQTAQIQYQSQYGCFASSLRELGPPETGGSSAKAAGLVSGVMARGETGGYKFSLTATCETYAITAAPRFLSSGRSFFSDQSMTLRASDGSEPATADSPEFAH